MFKKESIKKPTLAFYIDSMAKGGANRVMANLVNYFTEQHYNVLLITDVYLDGQDSEYQVDARAKRRALNCKKSSVVLSNICRIRKLRALIKQEKIDVIVSFMGPPNIRLLLAGAFLKCKKFVSVRNDPNVEYGSGKLIKCLAGLIFGLADGCVFQTEDAKEYFPGRVQKKSRVILNPVNPDFCNIERKENTKDIVSVGRLVEQKNHILLISAFEKLCNSFPNENLYIYGEGALREKLQQFVQDKKLEDRVFLPGQILNVADILSRASVFVLSSDYEGLPNALMEAMAVGAPVISTDCPCGGPGMLIEDNVDGLLVACNDADKMAEAIGSVLSNRERSLELGKRAKEKAESFKPETVCREWENYLLGFKDE